MIQNERSKNIQTHINLGDSNAASTTLHLETMKKKYAILLDQYRNTQTNYFQHLNKYSLGNYIINGNFKNPPLESNTYTNYIINTSTIVPGWNFTGNALLSNNSNIWTSAVPYPNGDQAVCLQLTGSISQTVRLTPGSYQLSWSACGRGCCDGSNESNPVNVLVNGNNVFQFQPPVNKWANYSTPLVVQDTDGKGAEVTIIISFEGTWTASDRSTLIQDIRLHYVGLKTIPKSAILGGSMIRTDQVNDLSSCVASCSSLSNCTGATYNNDEKLCSLHSGKGNIMHSENSNNYAIISGNLYYLNLLKEINQQLTILNNQIQTTINQGRPVYNRTIKELGNTSTYLNEKYSHLNKEREKLDAIIQEYENLKTNQNEVSLKITNYYSIFLFLLFLSFLIILVILFLFTKKTSTTISSSANSNLTNLQNIQG